VDSSQDAIVSKTLGGIVTSWNRAAEELFGWTAQEMIGESILRIIPEELAQEEAEILAKLRAGERVERYETVRMHRLGGRLDISLTVSPVRDLNGVIVGAAKIAHDITRRRRAERALEEEKRALETLNQVGQAMAAQLELERIVQVVTALFRPSRRVICRNHARGARYTTFSHVASPVDVTWLGARWL
jgi:PAS domain S-box-containing protein